MIHSQEEKMSARQQDWGELPPRQEFALNLAISWPPFTVVVTCNKLVKYVQSLPVEKGKLFKHSDGCSFVTYPFGVGNRKVLVCLPSEVRKYCLCVGCCRFALLCQCETLSGLTSKLGAIPSAYTK